MCVHSSYLIRSSDPNQLKTWNFKKCQIFRISKNLIYTNAYKLHLQAARARLVNGPSSGSWPASYRWCCVCFGALARMFLGFSAVFVIFEYTWNYFLKTRFFYIFILYFKVPCDWTPKCLYGHIDLYLRWLYIKSRAVKPRWSKVMACID